MLQATTGPQAYLQKIHVISCGQKRHKRLSNCSHANTQ